MSLDVYLTVEGSPAVKKNQIFIREAGATVAVTREEWDKRFPGREPVMCTTEDSEVYEANITHNLSTMAEAAGIYECLWSPGHAGVTKASQLIGPLTDGLMRLQIDPERFEAMNPKNGWGDYDGLVRFVADYLEACKAYPDATVRVCA